MSEHETSKNTANSELLWTGFQYFVGELTDDEAAAFETRLADDQAARETLAEVVALVETTRAAAGVTPGPGSVRRAASNAPTTGRRERLGWAAIGMAASLALMMGYESIRPALM